MASDSQTGPHDAREAALQTLYAVEVKAAFAHLALSHILRTAALPPRERALATELAQGTVRMRAAVDFALAQFCHYQLTRLSPWIRNLLRLAAYELLFLHRTSPAATCHAAVELAKQYGHPGTVRLVNAVLRRLSEQRKQIDYPPFETDPVGHLTTRLSHPRWLVERWLQRWPPEEVRALCLTNNRPPPLTVRVNRLRLTPEDLRAQWEVRGVKAQPCRWAPEGLVVGHVGEVQLLWGFDQGWFTVQDEASMLVGYLAAPQPGWEVADLCSAPGGKATHLAELMGDRGRVWAVDLHSRRLQRVAETAVRLGLRNLFTRCADARRVAEVLPQPLDLVLLDVPCTGTGTLRRRADARWRKQPEQLEELVTLQRELLSAAAELVRPGGVLVYSTCSLEPEENEEQIRWFRERYSHFVPALEPPPEVELPGLNRAEGWLHLWPPRDGTDGAFLARLRRG